MKKIFLGLYAALAASSSFWAPFVFTFTSHHPTLSGAIATGAALALHFTQPPAPSPALSK